MRQVVSPKLYLDGRPLGERVSGVRYLAGRLGAALTLIIPNDLHFLIGS